MTTKANETKPLLAGGKAWEKKPTSVGGGTKWASECGNFEIFLTSDGKYRLLAFEHSPSTQFPQAEFWMREYGSLEAAAKQAESM